MQRPPRGTLKFQDFEIMLIFAIFKKTSSPELSILKTRVLLYNIFRRITLQFVQMKGLRPVEAPKGNFEISNFGNNHNFRNFQKSSFPESCIQKCQFLVYNTFRRRTLKFIQMKGVRHVEALQGNFEISNFGDNINVYTVFITFLNKNSAKKSFHI